MNKIFLLIFLFDIFFSKNNLAQLKLVNKNNNCIEVIYFNDSSKTAYFIDPTFYTINKLKKKKAVSYLRFDMFEVSTDTLFLYLGSNKSAMLGNAFKASDSAFFRIGFSNIDSLISCENRYMKIRFPRKLIFNSIVIYYQFSFKKENLKKEEESSIYRSN